MGNITVEITETDNGLFRGTLRMNIPVHVTARSAQEAYDAAQELYSAICRANIDAKQDGD